MRQRTSFSAIISLFFALVVLTFTLASTGCNDLQNDASQILPDTNLSDPNVGNNPDDPTQTQPPNELPPTTPPTSDDRHYATGALLYNGLGISTSDANTIALILKNNNLSYKMVNSAQLNAMSLDDMANYGVIIIPGGHGDQITNGLSASTRIKVRDAVRDRGVGYVGFCAGAWVAIEAEPAPGTAAKYGFGIVTGSHLKVYRPNGQNPTAAIVNIKFSNGTKRDVVWWGGPYLLEWANGVISRYSTGEPAMTQTMAGKGFVVLSGPHPEAPEGWRTSQGLHDSDGLDYDIAWDLIEASLKQLPLPTF